MLVVLAEIYKKVIGTAVLCLRSNEAQLIVKSCLKVLQFIECPDCRFQNENVRIIKWICFFIEVSLKQRIDVPVHIFTQSVELFINFPNHFVVFIYLHKARLNKLTLFDCFNVESFGSCG